VNVAQGLLVETGEHRIEGMLENSRVPARGRTRQLCLLEQLHPRAGLGEKRRRRAADDPPAYDRDVGVEAQSSPPLA
jgi:hypothetical protein